VIEISDLINLDEFTKTSLADILKKNSETRFWGTGTHDHLNLNFKILKHNSSNKIRTGISGPRVRYEVVDTDLFSIGTYSKYYRCRFKLSIDDKGNLQIKERKPGRVRLVKEQNIIFNDEYLLDEISSEAAAMMDSDIFHSKPLVVDGDKTYIIMRELPGITLSSLIKENNLTIQERYNLSLALLNALKMQIHDKGYIHRDIKPDNILVYMNGDQFEIYIIDFGFISKTNAKPTDCRGSPQFAASECSSELYVKNEKTDIYALGIVFKFLWHGVVLKPQYSVKLMNIIDNMCSFNMNHRSDISVLIELFNSLAVLLFPTAEIEPVTNSSRYFSDYYDIELDSIDMHLDF
jgi:serine/threonine protein kinase